MARREKTPHLECMEERLERHRISLEERVREKKRAQILDQSCLAMIKDRLGEAMEDIGHEPSMIDDVLVAQKAWATQVAAEEFARKREGRGTREEEVRHEVGEPALLWNVLKKQIAQEGLKKQLSEGQNLALEI